MKIISRFLPRIRAGTAQGPQSSGASPAAGSPADGPLAHGLPRGRRTTASIQVRTALEHLGALAPRSGRRTKGPVSVPPASGTDIAVQHAEVAQTVRQTLTDLRAAAGRNDEVLEALAPAFTPGRLPVGGLPRLSLVRTADNFLDRRDMASYIAAQDRLVRLALGDAGNHPITEDQRQQVLGTLQDRRDALESTLPFWLAGVTDLSEADALVARAPYWVFDPDQEALRSQVHAFVREANVSEGGQLPPGTAWLADPRLATEVLDRYETDVQGGGSHRHLPAQLITLASDLSSLQGNRMAFVRMLGTLMRRDALQAAAPAPPAPLLCAWDRLSLLLALSVQLPVLGAGEGHVQREVLELLRDNMATPPPQGLDAAQRVELLRGFIPVVGRLPPLTDGVPEPQRDAVDVIVRGLQGQEAWLAAPALIAITQHAADWYRPAGREAALGEVEHVLDGLRGATPSGTALRLIPLAREVLRQTAPQAPLAGEARLRAAAWRSLVRGGLPASVSPQERDNCMTLGIGGDLAERCEAARALAAIASGADPLLGREPATRLAAARYLHHLLESGHHGLPEDEQARARHAIGQGIEANLPERGTATRVRDRLRGKNDQHRAERAAAVLAAKAFLQESPALEGAVDGAHDLRRKHLAMIVAKDLRVLDLEDMVAATSPVVRVHHELSPARQRKLNQQLLGFMREDPAARGLQTRPQTIGLSILRDIGSGPDAGLRRELGHQALKRLNADHQGAAIAQLFDGFDAAPATGRLSLVRFIGALERPDHFTAAAAPLLGLIESTDPGMPAAWKQEAATMAARRARELPGDDFNQLVSNVVRTTQALPVEVWSAFIERAAELDPPATRALFLGWMEALPTLDAAEAGAMARSWAEAPLDEGRRAMVHAFAQLGEATQAHAQALHSLRGPVTAAGALHLIAALKALPEALIPRAMSLVDARGIGPLDIEALLDQDTFVHLRPEIQDRLIGLCHAAGPARTLRALAARAGVQELNRHRGGVWIPPLARSIPTSQGDLGLRDELLTRPVIQVLPALEALAENLHVIASPAIRAEVIDTLRRRLPELVPSELTRLRQALFLLNPSAVDSHGNGTGLGDDDIRALGDDPTASEWAALRALTYDERAQRLTALRATRFSPASDAPITAAGGLLDVGIDIDRDDYAYLKQWNLGPD